MVLVERQTIRDYYEVETFARLVGKARFTVREWCRHSRIRAGKRRLGIWAFPECVISHTELLR
jgi:hypothetical protein